MVDSCIERGPQGCETALVAPQMAHVRAVAQGTSCPGQRGCRDGLDHGLLLQEWGGVEGRQEVQTPLVVVGEACSLPTGTVTRPPEPQKR